MQWLHDGGSRNGASVRREISMSAFHPYGFPIEKSQSPGIFIAMHRKLGTSDGAFRQPMTHAIGTRAGPKHDFGLTSGINPTYKVVSYLR
jgi:hypothetical protein